MSFKTRKNHLGEKPYVRSLFYGTHIWFWRVHRQLRIYVFVLVSCALIHGEKLLLKRLPPLGDPAPCVPVPSFQKPWLGHHPHGPTRHGRRLPESVAVGNRLPEPRSVRTRLPAFAAVLIRLLLTTPSVPVVTLSKAHHRISVASAGVRARQAARRDDLPRRA
jgi:hypothetical protein